jgi:hypothetical protein
MYIDNLTLAGFATVFVVLVVLFRLRCTRPGGCA